MKIMGVTLLFQPYFWSVGFSGPSVYFSFGLRYVSICREVFSFLLLLEITERANFWNPPRTLTALYIDFSLKTPI